MTLYRHLSDTFAEHAAIYSLACLSVVAAVILFSLGLVTRLWCYLIFLFFECVAVWFIVVSVILPSMLFAVQAMMIKNGYDKKNDD